MQEETSRLSTYAQQVGPSISLKKTKVMTLNTPNPAPIKVEGEDIPATEQFTYLGSIVRHDGGADNDIQSRLNKARNAFRVLNNMWRSTQDSNRIKLKLHQNCVLSTLLYGSECWRIIESDLTKLSTYGKFFVFSGHEPSQTKICLGSVARKARVPSLCKDAGGGWVMSSDRKMVRSQRLPFTGSRKASVDEVGPR